MKNIWLPVFLIVIVITEIRGQSVLSDSIDNVILTATRISQSRDKTPLSVTVLKTSAYNEIQQNLSLDESLQEVPGLFTQNASNYAQDLRISIRGFGSRAAFGIRGIKLVVDGVPETTPDGQGQIDNISLGLIDQVEIIRGPSSTLYGNASGGVIRISNNYKVPNSFVEVSSVVGSYGMHSESLELGSKFAHTELHIHASNLNIDGYRNHSEMSSRAINLSLKHQITDQSKFHFLANYTSSPKANDPGGINLDASQANRRQARQRNVDFDSGESVKHFKTSLSYENKFSDKINFISYAYLSTRRFDGKLPFEFGGIVDLDRTYWGHNSAIEIHHLRDNQSNKLLFGYDMGRQSDHRNRLINNQGQSGDETLNQIESFNNLGFFILDNFQRGKWTLNGGIRYDFNGIGIQDKLTADGDDSGNHNINSFNPSLGIHYDFGSHGLFLNYSTSFETPTLSELSANPSGQGGFNEDLKNLKARNYEVGWKSQIKEGLYLELVAFVIKTDNEILPFEIEQFPGRDFYRNIGKTKRKGLETSIDWKLRSDLSIKGQYSIGKYQFAEISGLTNKNLPGIPEQTASLSIHYNHRLLNFRILTRWIGSFYGDDTNMVRIEKHTISDFSIGKKIHFRSANIQPIMGIKNLFNEKYFDNIRINAFGGRYYEPASERVFYGGVRFRFGD